jgi:hypothetical protein
LPRVIQIACLPRRPASSLFFLPPREAAVGRPEPRLLSNHKPKITQKIPKKREKTKSRWRRRDSRRRDLRRRAARRLPGQPGRRRRSRRHRCTWVTSTRACRTRSSSMCSARSAPSSPSASAGTSTPASRSDTHTLTTTTRPTVSSLDVPPLISPLDDLSVGCDRTPGTVGRIRAG